MFSFLRSYMAGEWELKGDNEEHDGLRQLFLFFVDNRDVSKDGRMPGMKVSSSHPRHISSLFGGETNNAPPPPSIKNKPKTTHKKLNNKPKTGKKSKRICLPSQNN